MKKIKIKKIGPKRAFSFLRNKLKVVVINVMARARSPNRDKAYEIYKESKGKKPLVEIAAELGVSDSQVRKWKNLDKWDDLLKGNVTNLKSNVTNKGGAPKGNKNAVGNRGGSAPRGNSNAVKHGFFRKYLPEDTLEIMEQIETRSPIDMLWDNIVIQYTAIIRAQQIMYVSDKEDETKVLKREKRTDTGWEDEYELQHAWDKHATFLNAQSRAMSTLQSLIKQYEELCIKGLATKEQRLRIEKLKGEIKVIEQKSTENEDKPIEIIIKRKGESND